METDYASTRRPLDTEPEEAREPGACGHHHHNAQAGAEEACACGHHHHKAQAGAEEACACGHHHHNAQAGAEEACSCGHHHHHGSGGVKGLVPVFLAAGLLLAGAFLPLTGAGRLAFFALPYLLAGWPVLREAGENILRGQVFDENFLMALASLGAFCIGEYREAVLVMALYRVGEFCEDLAVEKSRRSIAALMDICPDTARVEREGQLLTLRPEEVAAGEIILVRPGERIPLDGTILSGRAAVDTAALTGEPVPRDLGPGDMARNGCISLDGVLRIQVSRPFAQSTVSRILALVEQSDRNKSRSETFIRRFARIYTPAVVAAAAALAVLPPLILGGGWGGWVRRALTFLVISCPCALVISVPLTFFAGIGGASRKGILIKGSRFVETLARAEVVAFDKTGTLTKGAFQVREVQPEGFSREELLELAAAAERHSSHPISRCLVEEARPGAAGRKVTDVQELSGLGIRATVDGRAVQVGNARLMEEAGIPLPGSVPDAPGTTVYVAVDGSYAGRIVVSDQAKEEAGTLVPALKALGVRSCVMLTGDREAAARPLAEELGMDRVLAELSPEDKVNQMGRLKQELSGKGRLVYVGDGINDAPVLARADAGIAMGAFGSDAAVEAADVVLMDDNPAHVPGAIAIARRTMAIARQNIAFALGIKAVVLVLGAMGLAPLWASVFADVGVCLLCILNALRAMVPEPRRPA